MIILHLQVTLYFQQCLFFLVIMEMGFCFGITAESTVFFKARSAVLQNIIFISFIKQTC